MKTIDRAATEYICSNNIDFDPGKSAFKAGVLFANTWYDIKESYAHEIEPLNEVLVKDANGEIEIAKLVHIGAGRLKGWKFEIKNSETIIDLEHITQFKPIDIK